MVNAEHNRPILADRLLLNLNKPHHTRHSNNRSILLQKIMVPKSGPLGALIALFNRFPPFKWISGVRLNKMEEKCTKCGICKRVCPTQVKDVYEKKGGDVATSQCIYCLRCVEMCPQEDCLQFKVCVRNWRSLGTG